jgi:threonylcarbamoyladenosine tRNA methylthiotransferase MtaB
MRTVHPSLNPPSRTVAFKTIGCRLNQAETAAITGHFTAAGYTAVEFGSPCDIAVIHGCAITRAAESESLQSARRAKRTNPDAIVILAGCPAETIKESIPADTADLVIGQNGKLALPALLHTLHPTRFPAPPPDISKACPHFETKRAFIKIQDGCDFHCAYCIVPAARGAPRSRPLPDILQEARLAVATGFREIILTGANLGRYQNGTDTLASLLQAIDAIPEIGRFRLGSVELTTAEHTVLDFMARSTKLCRFLHLPLQSGDDPILNAMGRRYRVADYRRVAETAVSRIPHLGLGTDIIVGFPGEDDAAFANTVRLVDELPFSNLHVFPYSRRPGTRADAMPHQIPEAVKKERVRILMDLAESKRSRFAKSFVGRNACILVERREASGLLWGWTSEYLEARVSSPLATIGQLLPFTVNEASGATLTGPALPVTHHPHE